MAVLADELSLSPGVFEARAYTHGHCVHRKALEIVLRFVEAPDDVANQLRSPLVLRWR